MAKRHYTGPTIPFMSCWISRMLCVMAYLWIFVLFSSFLSCIFLCVLRSASSFFSTRPRNIFDDSDFTKQKGFGVQCTRMLGENVLKCTFIQIEWVSFIIMNVYIIMALMAWKRNYGWLNIEHWTYFFAESLFIPWCTFCIHNTHTTFSFRNN